MGRKPKDKFAFWPSDWIGGTQSMSPGERGVYIDLLCCQWTEGPLSEEQAFAAGRAERALIWAVLSKKFHRNPDGRWQNNRLEQERQRLKASSTTKASKRPVEALATIPGLEMPQQQETAVSVNCGPVMVFPCRGEPSLWGLPQEQYDNWKRLYSGLDVLKELAKALAWVQANGGKTAKGMPKFLVNWLNRATDSAKGSDSSFRQRDNQERARVRLKLKLEGLGLSGQDAARLAALDETTAVQEARKLLAKQVKQEVIPW